MNEENYIKIFSWTSRVSQPTDRPTSQTNSKSSTIRRNHSAAMRLVQESMKSQYFIYELKNFTEQK